MKNLRIRCECGWEGGTMDLVGDGFRRCPKCNGTMVNTMTYLDGRGEEEKEEKEQVSCASNEMCYYKAFANFQECKFKGMCYYQRPLIIK